MSDRPRTVCEPCWEGDHSNHKPALGGICIGCTCAPEGSWPICCECGNDLACEGYLVCSDCLERLGDEAPVAT